MYDVQTDHQVVAFGADLMGLFDTAGTLITQATRADGAWTITADGVDAVTADNRPGAITALVDQSLAALGGAGYSTLVPHGLPDLP